MFEWFVEINLQLFYFLQCLQNVDHTLNHQMKNRLAMALFIILSVFSCENQADVNIESLSELDIQGCWTHAREEEENLYRPCNSQNIPISRFRQVFEFKADGVCEYLVLASNDGHYMETGLWDFNENTNEVRILNPQDVVLLSFVITDISNDSFKLEITSENSFIGN